MYIDAALSLWERNPNEDRTCGLAPNVIVVDACVPHLAILAEKLGAFMVVLNAHPLDHPCLFNSFESLYVPGKFDASSMPLSIFHSLSTGLWRPWRLFQKQLLYAQAINPLRASYGLPEYTVSSFVSSLLQNSSLPIWRYHPVNYGCGVPMIHTSSFLVEVPRSLPPSVYVTGPLFTSQSSVTPLPADLSNWMESAICAERGVAYIAMGSTTLSLTSSESFDLLFGLQGYCVLYPVRQSRMNSVFPNGVPNNDTVKVLSFPLSDAISMQF